MKNKWNLIVSVFQLFVGVLAIIVFVMLAINKEIMTKWVITLVLAILFVFIGINGIIDYKSKK